MGKQPERQQSVATESDSRADMVNPERPQGVAIGWKCVATCTHNYHRNIMSCPTQFGYVPAHGNGHTGISIFRVDLGRRNAHASGVESRPVRVLREHRGWRRDPGGITCLHYASIFAILEKRSKVVQGARLSLSAYRTASFVVWACDLLSYPCNRKLFY